MAPSGRSSKPILTILCTIVLLLVSLYVVDAGRDFYKILGVSKNSSDKDIKKAFRKLSMKYHPDQNPSESAKNKYIEINNAYDVLSSPDKRKIYDLHGEEGINQSAQGGHPGGNPFGGNPFGGGGGFHFSSGGGGADFFQQFFGGGGGGFGGHQQRRQQPQQPATPLYDKDPFVIELTDATWPFFRTETQEEKEQLWFVKFYSSQCGHCHQVAPAWKEAAKELKGVVKVAAINCQSSQRVCTQANIESYPTFLLYPFNSRQPVTYAQNSKRTKDDFVKFALNQLPSFISTTTPSAILDTISKGQYLPTVIILAPGNRTPLISPTLQTLAKQFRKHFKFVAISIPTTSQVEFDHLYELLNRDAISPLKTIKNDLNAISSPIFFFKTPYQTIPYTGQASFKQLTATLTEYKHSFTEKGFYAKDFSTFMMQNRGTLLTPSLLSLTTVTPAAQYQNIILTCPWIVNELTSFEGYNAQHPTQSKFSTLHPLYSTPEPSTQSTTHYTPNQINAVVFEMMQILDNKVHLVDVTKTETGGTVDLFKKILNLPSFDQDLLAIQNSCDSYTAHKANDKITDFSVTKQKMPFIILGLNFKRNRYTIHSPSSILNTLVDQAEGGAVTDIDVGTYLNGVDNFMSSNESSPQGAKPVAKRIKVALGLETEHDEL